MRRESQNEVSSNPHLSSDEAEDLRIYFSLQYERIAQLEQQRLTLTEVIVAITTFAIPWAFSEVKTVPLIGVLAGVALVVLNAFAAIHTYKSWELIKMHQERAKGIRAKMSPKINDVHNGVAKPHAGLLRRAWMQAAVHVILAAICVLGVTIAAKNM